MKIIISLFCFISACSAMRVQNDLHSFSEAEKTFAEAGSSAVVVLQQGKTLIAWGDISKPLHVHSIRKSILNALYGIHSHKINLSSTLKELNIAGTFWYYNNWDFNALGTIFKQTTGMDVFEAFHSELAIPLCMEDFNKESHTKWRFEPASHHPAYKFELSARDLARFGQLFLNQGHWQGKEIIPVAWIKESLKPYSHAKPGVGYGYFWWVADGNMQFGQNMGEKTYSARGFNGQLILIFPEKELVIVHLTDRSVTNAKFGSMVNSILHVLAQADN